MKKFLLYAHGGSSNHGAEAIVKSTIQCIREKYPDAWIGISTHFPEQDLRCGVQADCLIPPDYKVWELEKKERDKEKKKQLAAKMYAEALNYIDADMMMLSVGGDNYCYGNWHRLAVFQEAAGARGAKSILWGASIEPSAMTPELIRTLNSYTAILARDSLTYEALKKSEVNVPIALLPDIAFRLLPKETDLLNVSAGYVGLNLSPLVVRREIREGIMYENFARLAEWIVNAGKKVLLIPHVTVSADDDREALTELYNKLKPHVKEKTVLMTEDLTAAEYKYMISLCDMLVCTRTHASVAAYSTNTPVLVVGYSVKSRGIARDIGMEPYVMRVEDIGTPDELCRRFESLCRNADSIRHKLLNHMPEYISNTSKYADYI